MSNPSEGKRYTTNKRETKKCIKRIKGERERKREWERGKERERANCAGGKRKYKKEAQ